MKILGMEGMKCFFRREVYFDIQKTLEKLKYVCDYIEIQCRLKNKVSGRLQWKLLCPQYLFSSPKRYPQFLSSIHSSMYFSKSWPYSSFGNFVVSQQLSNFFSLQFTLRNRFYIIIQVCTVYVRTPKFHKTVLTLHMCSAISNLFKNDQDPVINFRIHSWVM